MDIDEARILIGTITITYEIDALGFDYVQTDHSEGMSSIQILGALEKAQLDLHKGMVVQDED